MKPYFPILFLCFASWTLSAQLKNHGGTIKVHAGGNLKVDGHFTNLSGSTLTNEGQFTATGSVDNEVTAIMEGDGQYFVDGDWTNTGTFTAGTSTVTFGGSANSTLTVGGALFHNLEIIQHLHIIWHTM